MTRIAPVSPLFWKQSSSDMSSNYAFRKRSNATKVLLKANKQGLLVAISSLAILELFLFVTIFRSPELGKSSARFLEGPRHTRSKKKVAPRVVFLEGQLHFPTNGRLVEKLGNHSCCEGDQLSSLNDNEKHFFETCTPMSEWQSMIYPTCNTVHELSLTEERVLSDEVSLLTEAGSWRSVWKVADDVDNDVVLKTLKFNRPFNEESFRLQQVDSLAMERMSHSKVIVDEFGFCGQSVLTEYAPRSARSFIKQKKLTTTHRLLIAHDLAQGLYHMHSIDYPYASNATFSHNDINIANLVEMNGRIKFNDFNLGVMMRWNKTKPCGYPVHFQSPLWRSPEEIRNSGYIMPEKSDIYSLGNVLFQVLTTHQPWTWLEPSGKLEIEEVAKRKLNGTLPFIPQKFLESNDTGVQALRFATQACFRADPEERPTSYQLLKGISSVLKWVQQRKQVSTEDVNELF